MYNVVSHQERLYATRISDLLYFSYELGDMMKIVQAAFVLFTLV